MTSGTIYRFLYPLVTRLIHLAAHVDIVGAEQMPRGGGVLLIANHLTNYDVFLIGICFRRILHFMGKIELFSFPPMAWFSRAMFVFPVRRGEADRSALRHAEEMLRLGRVVAIFPEGHRSKGAALQAGQPGIVLLARRTGVPILPVAITGTEQFRPRPILRWRPWRRPTITVTVGAPFTIPHAASRADSKRLADTMMARIVTLLPPSYRGVYAAPQVD